jgi:carboxypeptidase PM20D1
MRKALSVIGALIFLLALVVVVRTARFTPRTGGVAQAVAPAELRPGAAERLGGAVRIATVSHAEPERFDASAFGALHAYLERTFPRAHREMRRETVGGHSLLYSWAGSEPALKPILIAGHMDVVPVEPGTESRWSQPPFAGLVDGGFVWGRGAIDNKSAVVGTLEAVEHLLAEGFRPRRTVLLAFGHDEEVGGTRGARAIAELLEQRGIQLEMVLDEGGVIGEGLIPGVSPPTALVGIAEKGFATVELIARGSGGHSSLPPMESPIGRLGAAIARLEEQQMPARLEEPTRRLFDRVGPMFPTGQRAAFANLWLTKPLVLRSLQQTPSTNAMVRTTTAVTVLQAGTKDNVLASEARAVINFRILQGDSIAGVLRHVRRVAADSAIEVRLAGAFSTEPSPVSAVDSPNYRVLERAITSVAPDVVVAPFLVVVVADARHYAKLTGDIYRFLPLRMQSADLARMHGTDERVAIEDYERAIRLYRRLIMEASAQAR